MKIAVLGATSQIAKDLIYSFSIYTDYHCTLFSRNSNAVLDWLKRVNIKKSHQVREYSDFSADHSFDVIINFVGAGGPDKIRKMGAEILDATFDYDMMALHYLKQHRNTKYIFLSSGAVYGGNFEQPVTRNSWSIIPINNLSIASHDWYMVAKLYAEAKHRSLEKFSIFDIRVFNYFSHTQDMNSGFLLNDILKALKNDETLVTSADNIVRDVITPIDFFGLFEVIMSSQAINIALDCYTRSPIDKFSLLSELGRKFGLRYEVSQCVPAANAPSKINYYSLNKIAGDIGYAPQRTSLDGIVEQVSFSKLKA